MKPVAAPVREWLGASIANRATALIAGTLFAVLALVCAANMLYVMRLTRTMALEQLARQTQTHALRLGLALEGAIDDGDNLARNPVVISAALDSGDPENYLRPILDHFQPQGRTPLGICVTDYKGRTIACTARPPDIAADLGLVARAIDAGTAQAQIVRRDGTPPLLHLVSPLVYFQSGRPEGTLVAVYDLAELFGQTLADGAYPHHVQLSAGALGPLVARGSPEGTIRHATPLTLRPPLDALRLELGAGVRAADVRGTLVDIALAYLVLALLMLPLVLLMARTLTVSLTARLTRLTGAAEKIAASGRLDCALGDTGDDEIARLAKAFAVMTARIGEINRGLEERIAERTRELADSEARLRSLGDNLPNGYVFRYRIADGRPHFLYVSSGVGRLHGLQPDEVLADADALFAQIDPPLRAALMAAHAESLAKLSDLETELRLRRADGREFWLELRAHPRRQDSGAAIWDGVAIDVTSRKQAEQALRQAASVFEHANEGIMITAPDGTILDVNAAFTQITGYGRDEVVGRNPRLLKSGRHGDEFYRTMWRALTEEGRWTAETWNRRKDGELFVEMQTISAVRGADGEILRYVALFSDITSLKAYQSHLEHIAHYDPLTGLPNRVLLAERLHHGMTQALRHGTRLAVAYIDLDGFKTINDTYSHLAGDRLLTLLATRMKEALREGDTLARLGGDEFVAVLLEVPDDDALTPLLERLLTAAAAPATIDGIVMAVSASIGVSCFPQSAEADAGQLMRQADQAMYLAKQGGKNRYRFAGTP